MNDIARKHHAERNRADDIADKEMSQEKKRFALLKFKSDADYQQKYQVHIRKVVAIQKKQADAYRKAYQKYGNNL